VFIQGTVEVDDVGLEVSRETAEVVSLFVILGGVCITVGCDIFRACFPSESFGGMVVHFGICESVLLASVSSATSSSATSSATASHILSAAGV